MRSTVFAFAKLYKTNQIFICQIHSHTVIEDRNSLFNLQLTKPLIPELEIIFQPLLLFQLADKHLRETRERLVMPDCCQTVGIIPEDLRFV